MALGQVEAETIVVVDGDGAYNLMAAAERRKEEDLHNLEEEEEHNPLLMKLADNAVDENEMNWKSVHCGETEHGSFVVVAAVGHRVHLQVDGDD